LLRSLSLGSAALDGSFGKVLEIGLGASGEEMSFGFGSGIRNSCRTAKKEMRFFPLLWSLEWMDRERPRKKINYFLRCLSCLTFFVFEDGVERAVEWVARF
jgi:hypothetical protein